jgi:hypothetical protein
MVREIARQGACVFSTTPVPTQRSGGRCIGGGRRTGSDLGTLSCLCDSEGERGCSTAPSLTARVAYDRRGRAASA